MALCGLATPVRLAAAGRALHGTALARFYGPVQQEVEGKLLEAFEPLHLEVTNESHGGVQNESHFHVVIVADQFGGKRALALVRPRWRSPVVVRTEPPTSGSVRLVSEL
jgi:hypothetical protein